MNICIIAYIFEEKLKLIMFFFIVISSRFARFLHTTGILDVNINRSYHTHN